MVNKVEHMLCKQEIQVQSLDPHSPYSASVAISQLRLGIAPDIFGYSENRCNYHPTQFSNI